MDTSDVPDGEGGRGPLGAQTVAIVVGSVFGIFGSFGTGFAFLSGFVGYNNSLDVRTLISLGVLPLTAGGMLILSAVSRRRRTRLILMALAAGVIIITVGTPEVRRTIAELFELVSLLFDTG